MKSQKELNVRLHELSTYHLYMHIICSTNQDLANIFIMLTQHATLQYSRKMAQSEQKCIDSIASHLHACVNCTRIFRVKAFCRKKNIHRHIAPISGHRCLHCIASNTNKCCVGKNNSSTSACKQQALYQATFQVFH